MAANETPLSALLAGLQKARGGKRLTQLRNRVMEAMAYQDTKYMQPSIYSAHEAASLGAGPSVIELAGKNLLIPADNAKKQAVASKAIFEGATPATDNVTLYARFPGEIGDFPIVIKPYDVAAAAADKNVDSAPYVELTPKSGDVDALVTAINGSSQLIRAVKNGTPVLDEDFTTALNGGIGSGIEYSLGQLLVQNTSEPNTVLNGGDSFIVEWHDDLIKISVHKDDLAPGKAIPTGYTALTAVEGTIMARFEWMRPLFEAGFQLNTKA